MKYSFCTGDVMKQQSMARKLVFLLSLCLMMIGHSSSWAQGSSSRSASSNDTDLAIRHYQRGNTYNNLGRYEDAIEEYRLSVAAHSEFLDSYRNMGNIFMTLERPEEAVPMYIRFVNLYDGPPDTALRAALTNIGNELRAMDRYQDALEYDLRAVQADRDNRSLVFLLGNAYENRGYPEKAAQVYEKALELHPTDAFFHRTLGRMYDEQDELEKALEHYRRAAEIDLSSDFYRQLVRETEERIQWRQQDNN